MTDYDLRVLRTDEYRAADTVFRSTVHRGPMSDTDWSQSAGSYCSDRVWGAFRDEVLVGTTQSFPSSLVVPGGASVPMAMVTRVGVRADHTRRGVMTALMRAQLAAFTEPVATLRASEAMIYGRFGYGVANRGRDLVVDHHRASLRPDAPTGGRVRVVDRVDGWWCGWPRHAAELDGQLVTAVHHGQDGVDGFASYYVRSGQGSSAQRISVLHLCDMHVATPQAWAGLWRFLLGLDLVDEVYGRLRPIDEPVELLLADRRAVRVTGVEDEMWLRLVDVPAALAARTFGAAPPVVIEVRDALLPANCGCYQASR